VDGTFLLRMLFSVLVVPRIINCRAKAKIEAKMTHEEKEDKKKYSGVSAKSHNAPFHTGELTKQGGQYKTWKTRYFVLSSESLLFYYKGKRDSSPTGVIDLRKGFTISQDSDFTGKLHCFRLATTTTR